MPRRKAPPGHAGPDEYSNEELRLVCKLQACWRGFLSREETEDTRMEMNWAAQKVQTRYRVLLGMKAAEAKRRIRRKEDSMRRASGESTAPWVRGGIKEGLRTRMLRQRGTDRAEVIAGSMLGGSDSDSDLDSDSDDAAVVRSADMALECSALRRTFTRTFTDEAEFERDLLNSSLVRSSLGATLLRRAVTDEEFSFEGLLQRVLTEEREQRAERTRSGGNGVESTKAARTTSDELLEACVRGLRLRRALVM